MLHVFVAYALWEMQKITQGTLRSITCILSVLLTGFNWDIFCRPSGFLEICVANTRFTRLFTEMPFKQVPVLEIDGVDTPLTQSFAIQRYIAREFGKSFRI
jgi:hypothetical protein